jgi:hypothetical protein
MNPFRGCMKPSAASMCLSLLLGVPALAIICLTPSGSWAAEWLAPAPEVHITADWVKDVERGLRSSRFKNVFMNQAFGCDQCRILSYLNDAADAMDSGEEKLARSFVRRALEVLKTGRENNWYTENDVRPIKRLIIKNANKGFREAGAPEVVLSAPPAQEDERYEKGGEPLFSRRSNGNERYGHERWSGYTSGSQMGLVNEAPYGESEYEEGSSDDMEADSEVRPSRRAQRDRQMKSSVQDALYHARRADAAGSKGDSQALIKHSKKALKKAKEGQRAGHNERLNEGVHALGEAIEHGKNHEVQDATEHVKHAIMKLSQSAGLQMPQDERPGPSSGG